LRGCVARVTRTVRFRIGRRIAAVATSRRRPTSPGACRCRSANTMHGDTPRDAGRCASWCWGCCACACLRRCSPGAMAPGPCRRRPPAWSPVRSRPGRPRRRTAVPARVVSRRRDFANSTDLFDFTQQLLPEVRDGDPEATWLLSRAMDECAGYAADPAAFARDSAVLAGMDLPASRGMQAARERVDTRCRRFGPRDGLSLARVQQLRWQAARAGGLAAEAELLARGQPLSDEPGYSDDLLERVGRAGDAQAFGAL